MVKFELFGKLKDHDKDKKEEKSELPVEEVRQLADQGYSQHEITEELRDRGYPYSQINKAMNRAVRESTRSQQDFYSEGPETPSSEQRYRQGTEQAERPRQQSQQERRKPEQQPREQERQDYSQQQPQRQQASYERQERPANQDYPGQVQQQSQDIEQPQEPVEEDWSSDVGITEEEEALIETIVEEKILDVEDEFETIYTQLETLQDTVDHMKEQIHDLQIRKQEDEKEFIQKIDEMEDYLETSQSRIGGLEKAFQQTLPSLVENVRDLTELVHDMKDKR